MLPGICSDWIFSLHLAVVLVPCKQLFNGFSLYCFTHILFLPNVLTALSAGSHPSLPSTCRHSSRGSLRDRNRWWLCANHAIMCRLYPTSFTIKQNPQFADRHPEGCAAETEAAERDPRLAQGAGGFRRTGNVFVTWAEWIPYFLIQNTQSYVLVL